MYAFYISSLRLYVSQFYIYVNNTIYGTQETVYYSLSSWLLSLWFSSCFHPLNSAALFVHEIPYQCVHLVTERVCVALAGCWLLVALLSLAFHETKDFEFWPNCMHGKPVFLTACVARWAGGVRLGGLVRIGGYAWFDFHQLLPVDQYRSPLSLHKKYLATL